MPLSNADLNAFSRALVEQFALRATGLDESSERLVSMRPSDHVLTGFLTPAGATSRASAPPGGSRAAAAEAEGLDVAAADDLPQDSAYEQSSIGLEWITPLAALSGRTLLHIEIQTHVYVRTFPTLAEQSERPAFRQPRGSRKGELPSVAATAPLVPVWQRQAISPLHVELDLSELTRRRQLEKDLAADIQSKWTPPATGRLYPGMRPLSMTASDIASREAYEKWMASVCGGSARAMPVSWRPVIDVRLVATPTEPGHARISLRLLNKTARARTADLDYVDPNLYGVGLRLRVPKRAHVPSIFRELRESYRYDRRMAAVGINAHVEDRTDGEEMELAVQSVPRKEVPRLEPRSIAGAAPLFSALAKSPCPILRGILSAMRDYDTSAWAPKIASLEGAERAEAESARAQFREEMRRFERGIDLLEDPSYPNVARAFSLMNEAMGKVTGGKKEAEWRLFQIVFIVSQIAPLAARQYPELGRADDDDVDILWFAAGGGKTEAFLGLILWQAFFDRMRGKRLGTTAMVRFPLRLLSFQQFQRVSRALAAAEVLRKREGLNGARFSLGLFVGKTNTPNRIKDDMHARYTKEGPDARYQRVFDCPFCGGHVKLGYEPERRLVKHLCERPACPGGPRELPIYIVDDDIYHYLPTVIVATVDKLASMGHSYLFANLFGRVHAVCFAHGASFGESSTSACRAWERATEPGAPPRCGNNKVDTGPFHDLAPSLLVQDEMHLLSEELGAFDAHYETGAAELARSLGARPWKIIGATATIEDYAQHAWQLYLRRARQFPGPGPEANDSFYYCHNPSRVGRIFVGVVGVGRKHTPSVTRVLSLLYLELQRARELAAKDPAGAARLYGTGPLSAEELRDLLFLYELLLTYVLTRKGSDQVSEAIESRVKKDLDALAPEHGELIVECFNSGVDINSMIQTMKGIQSQGADADPAARVRGLIATNIIGHGVDVNRFNIMVFAGYTRLAAEYIQASARVGRTFPGISLLVCTPQSERDRSIFDRFAKFHEYVDRLVDPSAVTRWSEAALERTVPGLLAAYLMGVASASLGRPIRTHVDVHRSQGQRNAAALDESAVVGWMERAYGVAHAPSPRYAERLRIIVKNRYATIVNALVTSSSKPETLGIYLAAMPSLRDVDAPATIRVGAPDEVAILRSFIHA